MNLKSHRKAMPSNSSFCMRYLRSIMLADKRQCAKWNEKRMQNILSIAIVNVSTPTPSSFWICETSVLRVCFRLEIHVLILTCIPQAPWIFIEICIKTWKNIISEENLLVSRLLSIHATQAQWEVVPVLISCCTACKKERKWDSHNTNLGVEQKYCSSLSLSNNKHNE